MFESLAGVTQKTRVAGPLRVEGDLDRAMAENGYEATLNIVVLTCKCKYIF